MSMTLSAAIYPGAAASPNRVTIRALGAGDSPARGVLRFVDSVGRSHPVAKAPPDQNGGARWVLEFEEGPEFVLPPWQAPTDPPARFHFELEVAAPRSGTDASERVRVVVCDDDGPIRASHPRTGEPVADDEVEMAGTFHLYLEG